MENLLQYLKSINPRFKSFSITEIKDYEKIIGYQCYGKNEDNLAFSGGTSQSKDSAIRIAIAEAFERSFVSFLNQDKGLKKTFWLDQYPSSSGFAVGFNDNQTRFRAVCESLERWAWSKWIDEGYKLAQFEPNQESLSSLTRFFLKSFDSTYWFRKKFSVNIPDFTNIDLQIVIFLGCSKNGIFPGSRVSTQSDDLFEHPVIEAHRNFTNFNIHMNKSFDFIDIIQERAVYFGSNQNGALEQIKNAHKNDWPSPSIGLLKNFPTGHPEIYLYRCLMKDFIGWHEGDVTRFVY